MQENNMVAGMGGLGSEFSALVDDAERQEMMAPKAIAGNLQAAGMIKGAQYTAIQDGSG